MTRAQHKWLMLLLLGGLTLLPAAAGLQSSVVAPAATAGQTSTLLPDGRWLLLGGQGPRGAVGTGSILDPRTGTTTPLPPVQQARAWHSATVLPDGTVLIVGGLGASGQTLAAPELLDLETQTVSALSPTGLTPRAHHTATLLTDGRVLIAGGVGGTGQTLAQAELWSPPASPVAVPMTAPRAGHTATLEPDGTVLLWGGVDASGVELSSGDRFDPPRATFVLTETPAVTPSDAEAPRLEASIPVADAVDVSVDSLIALRVSTPLRVDSANADSVALTGPNGAEAVRVVAAEHGMLVFLTPAVPLIPGVGYTVSVNGAEGPQGALMPFTQVRFTTGPAGTGSSEKTAGQAAHQHHPAGPPASPGMPSELDAFEWTGEVRDGRPHSRWQELSPLQAPVGMTALAGQVLRLNGEPLADVTLEIGARSARTDQTGRFLLTGIDAGLQDLEMDGSTANRPGRTYGMFDYGVQIVANQTTVLPFTIWMPLLDMRHATPLPVPTPEEVVATTPLIPGLEVHIPADVVLRTYDGPLTVLPLTRIPVDRPPFPLPPGTTYSFTPQGHGARVERPDGSPSPTGVRMILPNPNHLPPGTRVDLWSYDYTQAGWYTYGQGTVSADGGQIGAVANFVAAILDGVRGGDPVDLGTGLLTVDKVDLVLPDVIPLVIRRQFRAGQVGWTYHTFQMYLTGDTTAYSFAELVLADGARVHYTRISPGTDQVGAVMEHTATPTAWYKSRLTWNAGRGGWDISMPDGTVYEIAGFGKQPGPMLVGIRDRVGNRLSITRHLILTSNVTRITSPNGRWVDVTQDGAQKVTQVRDNLGRTVSYTYDASFRLTGVTDAAGGVTQYTYDGYNHLLTVRDPRNIVYLTNEYDANNRVTKQTQADGTFFLFAYTLDGAGKVTQTDVTDPRGNVRRVTFNAAGYPLTDTRAFGTPLAQTTTYVRDATSSLVTVRTDALGRRTDYTYDTMGNVLTVTRLAGTADAVTTTFTYTATFNQVATVTDPLSHTATFGYDGVGNLTAITDPVSHQTTLTYNAAGQPLTITTPAGTTQLGYDQGDLATLTDPTGKTTTRFSDGAGRPISVTNPLGQRTRYDYDALNQLTKVTDPLGGLTQFSYDPNGNLLTVTDARSSVTSYTYNSTDRATTRTDPLLQQESFAYDNSGNPTNLTDRKSQVTSRTYDALDRLSSVTYQDGATRTYTWDAGNRLTQLVDSLAGTITRSYDGLDRLSQETTAQGTVSYTYDAASRRTSLTVLGHSPVTYGYDTADRLTQVTQGSSTVTFAYDTANRRTSLTLPNGVVTEYSYDAASRLTGLTYRAGATVLGTLTYGYDSNGSRTGTGGTWAATGVPQPVAAATYDAANRQVSFGGQTLTYDLDGNLTSDGTHTYTWDARNQLVAITGTSVTASFGYDARGRRQGKTVNGAATQFLYDGLDPVQELTGATVSANLLTGLGIDEYFTRTDATGASHFLTDALGSTVALTDATSAVPTTYSYEPFGATTITGATTGNSFDYTGRENDGTGLHYYRARYYHPGFQRFISEDPIGLHGGDGNLYAYVSNSPVVYVDPLGLVTEPAPGPVLDPFGTPRRGGRKHKGIDLRSPKGTCVVASDEGAVIKINRASAGGAGGNEIVVETVSGDVVVYSHTEPLSSVGVGSVIAEGQGIGRSDYGSGTATGRPHLHYQYRPYGANDYVDPSTHLSGASPYPGATACSPLPRTSPMAGRK